MNIPAHVLAHANPLARQTLARMQARDMEMRTQPTSSVGRRPTPPAPAPKAEPKLRVDIVADAKQRAGMADSGKPAAKNSLASARKEMGRSSEGKPGLRVDIVADMRQRHGLAPKGA